MIKKFVIGIDYGTDSVRSVVVDTGNGEIAGTSVFEYPRWKKGLFCDPAANKFRQHPPGLYRRSGTNCERCPERIKT